MTNVLHAGVRLASAAPPAVSPRGHAARDSVVGPATSNTPRTDPSRAAAGWPGGTIAQWKSAVPGCGEAIHRGPCALPATGRRRERQQPRPGAENRSGSPPSGSARADRKAATTVDRHDTRAEIRQTRVSTAQTARTASAVGTGGKPAPPADHLITSGGSGETSRIRDVETARAKAPRDAEEAGTSSREDCVRSCFPARSSRKGVTST